MDLSSSWYEMAVEFLCVTLIILCQRRITLNDFIKGLKYGYPLCCIIGYCLGNRALRNGVIIRDNLHDVYVPCKLHRKKAISHLEYLSLLNDGDLSWYIPSEEELFYHGSLRTANPKL